MGNRRSPVARTAPVATLIAMGVAAGLCGCATRGFVRNEVRGVNQRVDGVASSADMAMAEARAAHSLARTGDERAQQALRQASVARDIALGNVRREEVRKTTVQFAFDSATLTSEAKATLDGVAGEVSANPNYMVLVSGYTDATGEAAYNVGLAQRRASAVNLYLAEKLGADFVRVAFVGLGEVQPVADNGSRDGRRMNRRCEVAIVRPMPLQPGEDIMIREVEEAPAQGKAGPS
jgi:outer membrane protein OmpA-like peptidoglycan-associated protein